MATAPLFALRGGRRTLPTPSSRRLARCGRRACAYWRGCCRDTCSSGAARLRTAPSGVWTRRCLLAAAAAAAAAGAGAARAAAASRVGRARRRRPHAPRCAFGRAPPLQRLPPPPAATVAAAAVALKARVVARARVRVRWMTPCCMRRRRGSRWCVRRWGEGRWSCGAAFSITAAAAPTRSGTAMAAACPSICRWRRTRPSASRSSCRWATWPEPTGPRSSYSAATTVPPCTTRQRS